MKPSYNFPPQLNSPQHPRVNGTPFLNNSQSTSFVQLFTPRARGRLINLPLESNSCVLGMIRLSYMDRLKVIDLLESRHLVEKVNLEFDFKDETSYRSEDIHNGEFKEVFTYLRTPESLYCALYVKQYLDQKGD